MSKMQSIIIESQARIKQPKIVKITTLGVRILKRQNKIRDKYIRYRTRRQT